MDGPSLHERMAAAAGTRTFRALAELTATHPETVRRYMQGQAPSVEFVAALCAALEVSAQWMLSGEGPMHLRDSHLHALKQASPADLLSAIAAALEALTDRVARIERFVHQIETRISPTSTSATDGHTTKTPADINAEAEARAQRIADAVAERPRPNDG